MADETSEGAQDRDGAEIGETSVKKKSRVRGIVAIVVITLGAVLSPVAVDAIWARNLALDTDRFVAQLGPLADDPEIQQAIVETISVDLLDAIDLKTEIEEALPEDLSLLALPVDAAIRQLVEQIATKIVESDQFSAAWNELLEVSHSTVVALLTGETDVVNATEGVVSLDLSSIRGDVVGALQETGVGVFDNLDTDKDVSMEIFESDALASAQGFVRLLDTLAWVFPLVMLGLFALGIAIANNRRRAVLGVGVGMTIAMLVHILLLSLGRSFYLEAVTGTLDGDAAAAMYDLLLQAPRIATRVMALIGLVIALFAVLFGPGAAAVKTREVFKSAAGRGSDQLSNVGGPLGAVGGFVAAHLRPLQITVGIIAVIVLLAGATPTISTVLWIVVIAVAVLFVLQILAGLGRGSDRNPEISSP
jgi:hypothetical protein